MSLRHQHAGIEGSQGHHMAQTLEQFAIAQQASPGTDRLAIAIENANDRVGEVADRFRIGVNRGACDRSGLWNADAGKIGRAAGPNRRFGYTQGQRSMVAHIVPSYRVASTRIDPSRKADPQGEGGCIF